MAYSAYMTAGRGYDLSLFETSGTAARTPAPKKVKKKQYSKIVEFPEINEETAPRRKHNVAALALGFVLATIVAVVVGIMIHGQVQLAEVNQQITKAQSDLETSRSEYVQINSRIDASLSTAMVEEYARNVLGMTKATNQQKEYICLTEGDKAEIFNEGEESIFVGIAEYFD